jgi:HK97 family phage major capsid protein
MDAQERVEQSTQLFKDALLIFNNPDATGEEKTKAHAMFEDGKRIKEELFRIREIEAMLAEVQADDKPKEGGEPVGWKDWEEVLQAVWLADHPKHRKFDPRLVRFKERDKDSGHEQKQMVGNVGASGGFLIAPQFLAQLQAVQAESAIVKPRATTIRMNTRQVTIPVLDQTGTTANRPHWFGGMIGYWIEEATQKTITTASFRQVNLVAKKFILYTRASDELLADSAISLGDFLAGPVGFAGAVSWYHDWHALNGTGGGQPLGVLNAGCTITVARQNTNRIQYLDLVNMLQRFLPSARGVWVVTQSAVAELMRLQDPSGQYVWQPNAREGVPQTLFGMPVIFTEHLPTLGTAGDVLLADFRYLLDGDRQAITIDTTEYDQWALDQTSWRVVHRYDTQPWLSVPITYQDGTTQVSPFVILGDKST